MLLHILLMVTISNNTSPLQIQIIVVDINDNPPVFPVGVYYITVYENTPVGQTVLTVAASDKDALPNATVTYSLLGTN